MIVRNRFPRISETLREDITGAALLAALVACRQRRPGSGSLGVYVASAVLFAALKAYRDLTREDRRFHPLPLDMPMGDSALTMADVAADPTASADARVLQEDWHHSLWRAVEGLQEQQRDILTLWYGEGLTGEQTAQRLGMSRTWVSKHRDRAMGALRGGWSPNGEGLIDRAENYYTVPNRYRPVMNTTD